MIFVFYFTSLSIPEASRESLSRRSLSRDALRFIAALLESGLVVNEQSLLLISSFEISRDCFGVILVFLTVFSVFFSCRAGSITATLDCEDFDLELICLTEDDIFGCFGVSLMPYCD